MFRVTREIAFCYGHRLLNYEGKCRHLHGHNARAVVTLRGAELDSLGMLVDFVDIKERLQCWIEENLDHNMLLSAERPDPAGPPRPGRTRLRDGLQSHRREYRPPDLPQGQGGGAPRLGGLALGDRELLRGLFRTLIMDESKTEEPCGSSVFDAIATRTQ